MNKYNYNKDISYFNIFKDLFNKNSHYQDIIDTYNKIKVNIDDINERRLIESLVNNDDGLSKYIPYNKFLKYLSDLNAIQFRNDTDTLKDIILCQTQDKSQINAVERIISRKPYKPTFKKLKDIRNNNNDNDIEYVKKNKSIAKNCPHCGRKCIRDKNASYVICGYTKLGYDWKGCGKDWCFKCNKILCKNWHIDHLYDTKNRIHTTKCCNEHSIKFNKKYPDDYCLCNINM